MIGDWVNKIVAHEIVKDIVGADDLFYGRTVYFKPILLNPKILLKNGFKKELDKDGKHSRFILIDGHTRFSLLYAKSVFQWLGPLDFKYVHELQHALRLCGITKNIIL